MPGSGDKKKGEGELKMRFRMGKGQVLAFDAHLNQLIEKMNRDNKYYPSLREIGEKLIPPQPVASVVRSLNRLAAAGRLSPEALLVYNAKNNLKIEKEFANEKTRKSCNVKIRTAAKK